MTNDDAVKAIAAVLGKIRDCEELLPSIRSRADNLLAATSEPPTFQQLGDPGA